MNLSLSPFAPENLVSRDGFGSAVPRQPAILHIQSESGAYLRDSFRFPRRRPFIYFERHWYALARPDKLGTGPMAYGCLNKYMDAAADNGRNPVSKHQIQPKYGE